MMKHEHARNTAQSGFPLSDSCPITSLELRAQLKPKDIWNRKLIETESYQVKVLMMFLKGEYKIEDRST